jgi:nitroreductase
MEVQEAFRSVRPCRAFLPRPVPDDALRRVIDAARLASTGSDQQPWRFIVVHDEERKRKVAQAVPRGAFLNLAPVILVALGLEEAAPALVGGYMMSYPLEVAAAIQNLTLAAAAEQLGTCWCTDFKEGKLRELFQLPEGVRVVGVLPLGYPDPASLTNGPAPGRMGFSEIVAFENFSW